MRSSIDRSMFFAVSMAGDVRFRLVGVSKIKSWSQEN
jgi:hypothetical protein